MGDVFQIIGSVLLIVVGVAVITYVLFRKSPVKSEEPEDEAQDGSAEEALEISGSPWNMHRSLSSSTNARKRRSKH